MGVGGGGGAVETFAAGDVCLAEDRTGEGHSGRFRSIVHVVIMVIQNRESLVADARGSWTIQLFRGSPWDRTPAGQSRRPSRSWRSGLLIPNAIPEAARRFSARRLAVVTTNSLAGPGGLAEAVRNILGPKFISSWPAFTLIHRAQTWFASSRRWKAPMES